MSDKWLTTESAGVRRHDHESSSSHVTQHNSAVKPAGTAPARLARRFTLAIAVIGKKIAEFLPFRRARHTPIWAELELGDAGQVEILVDHLIEIGRFRG